jgi:glycosyltransferase involved in cell wall biosynthesis
VTGSRSAVPKTCVLFVNSGILGHRAVAELLKDSAARIGDVTALHLNLSENLTVRDRIVRRLLCARLAPHAGPVANIDLARWRQEMNAGLLAARRIGAAERSASVDVLHFHTQPTAYASLARMRRTPSIVSIDATERLASLEMTSALARATYRANIAHDGAVFRAARAITSTSHWAARDLADAYPDCAGKVRVMPYPVRASAFSGDWIEARAARAMSDRGGAVRVLFMGGDFPRKGGPELLEAWREAAFADRAQLDLVTDWPIESSALPPGVRVVSGIAPYTPAWFDLWQRADVFVMPTRHEAFGMVFQEAAAAAVPAIATAINAIPELVEDGSTGLLIKPGDRGDLVRAMRTLVQSPDLRVRMGAAARNRMLAMASPDTYAAQLNALIKHVQESHAQRP